jgi:hypothetical protein
MMQSNRHPLTLRVARTVAETRREPADWWEGKSEPQHVIACNFPTSSRVQRLIAPLLKRLRHG